MTSDRDLKRVIRTRAGKTGESYQAARRQLLAAGLDSPAGLSAEDERAVEQYFDDWRAWLERFRQVGRKLRDWPEGRRQWDEIPVPVEAMQRAVMHHPSAAIRRACLEVLDHKANDSSMPVFRAALRDPVPRVRLTALHGLGCVRCKSEPVDFSDVVPELLGLLSEDPNAKVRYAAATQLSYLAVAGVDERVQLALAAAAERDDDEFVRLVSASGATGSYREITSRKALRRRRDRAAARVDRSSQELRISRDNSS